MTEPTAPLVPEDFAAPAGWRPSCSRSSRSTTGDGYDADVRSWTRADRAHLDRPLFDAVSRWLSDAWPFRHPDYAAR